MRDPGPSGRNPGPLGAGSRSSSSRRDSAVRSGRHPYSPASEGRGRRSSRCRRSATRASCGRRVRGSGDPMAGTPEEVAEESAEHAGAARIDRGPSGGAPARTCSSRTARSPNVVSGLIWRHAGARTCVWNQRDTSRSRSTRRSSGARCARLPSSCRARSTVPSTSRPSERHASTSVGSRTASTSRSRSWRFSTGSLPLLAVRRRLRGALHGSDADDHLVERIVGGELLGMQVGRGEAVEEPGRAEHVAVDVSPRRSPRRTPPRRAAAPSGPCSATTRRTPRPRAARSS